MKRNLTHVYWITAIIVVMIGLFLAFYKKPLNNKDNRNEVYELLKDNYSVVEKNTIMINPHEGVLVSTKEDGLVIREEGQSFSFIEKTDSSTTKYSGWIFTSPKFFGYNIDSIKVY